uniref:Uncharacterized protein n=1 Tax=Gossypium raimondii TaxID=29730 RepID=A0A0D2TTK2_GOSRA|nr:hypothetical protein B456_008G030500 [Gossypium raimondii]
MCFYVTGHEVDPTVINVSDQNFNSSRRLWLTSKVKKKKKELEFWMEVNKKKETRGVNDGEFRERKELVGDLSQ